MSNSKIKAVEDFRNLSRGFKAVIALADELEAVGNLHLASDELSAGIGKLQKEREALQASNAEALAAATAEAEAIVTAAKTAAGEATAAAEAEAARTRRIAREGAEAVHARAQAECEAAQAARDAAEAAREQADQRHAALLVEVGELEGRLSKAQAQARKLLGE